MPDTIHAYAPLWGVWQIQETLTQGSWGPLYKIFMDAGGKRAYALAACVFVPLSASAVYGGDIKRGVSLELEDLQALNGSPNIVRIDEFTMHARRNGAGYDLLIRMEYLLSFMQYKSANTLSRKDSLVLALHTCYALNQCGGVHGDICPQNIFLSPDGNYKLGCFALAFQKTGRKGADAHTLLYASPELYKGKPLNRSADVYSLGLLLYSLLNSDKPPFMHSGMREEKAVRLRLKGKEPPPPEAVDVRLASVLIKATAHDPLDRYFTADELEQALRPCLLTGANDRMLSRDMRDAIVKSGGKKLRVIYAIPVLLVLCIAAALLIFNHEGGKSAGALPTSTPLTALFSQSPTPSQMPQPSPASTPGVSPTASPTVSPGVSPTASSDAALVSTKEKGAAEGIPAFIPNNPIVNTRGNTAGNLANGGIVARQGDWLYFAGYGGGIYSMSGDDAAPKLLMDVEADHLNILGEYLYFRNLTDAGRVYRLRADGYLPEPLTTTGAGFLYADRLGLYYTGADRFNLYSMPIDGGQSTLLSDDECLHVNIEDGWIYYLNGNDSDSLYSIRTDGSERARVSGDRSAHICVYDGWAYYNNAARHGFLYKVKADGTGKVRVNNDNTAHINVLDGYVYYAGLNTRGALYRVGVNGGSKQALADDDTIAIQLAGKWVYYRNRSDGYALYRVQKNGTGRERVF